MAHILILTKKDNVKELTDYIKCKVMIDNEKISKDYAYIKYEDGLSTITIRKFSEQGCIGKRSKIILYDGDFLQEEIETILKPMCIDILVDYDGRKPETLLSPIGILYYLLNDVSYIITDAQRDSESIQYVTKDMIKAFNTLRDGKNHNVYCHEYDKEDGELWWHNVYSNQYDESNIDDFINENFKELN